MRIHAFALLIAGCVDAPATEETLTRAVDEPEVVRCDTLHAAKIATSYGLASCDEAITSAHLPSGIEATDAHCVAKTANECAQHFLDRPADGLIGPTTATGLYEAIHFATRPGDPRMPDGTVPLLYYRPGSGAHQNDWIIFLQGGANMCTTEVIQFEPSPEAPVGASSLHPLGRQCFEKLDYRTQDEGAAGTGVNRERWKDLSSVGILGELPVNPDFAEYNRVYIVKPNDGWVGSKTHADVPVHDDEQGRRWEVAEMQTRGDAIVRAALSFLASSNGRTRDLRRAQDVLFVASSSGTNAIHRIDAWRADVAAHTTRLDPTPAYVGMMLNSAIAMPEPWTYEAADQTPCASVFRGDCPVGHDDPPVGHLSYRLEAGTARVMTFDSQAWDAYAETPYEGPSSPLAPGAEWVQSESIGQLNDESCVLAELARPWRCRSRQYVLLHHVGTPVFLAHSLHDSSDGKAKGQTLRLSSGRIPTWDDLAAANPWVEAPLETLTRDLLVKYARNRDNAAPGGASGESKNAGPIGIWASDCAQHEPEKWFEHFASGDVRIGGPGGGWTLSEAVRVWFEVGAPVIRIDGYGGSNTLYATYQPRGCIAD